MPSSIKLKDIRIDGGTQSRTKLNERHLQHLLEVLNDDGRLEPVEVIYDGVDYWLWDGFHRVEAYRRAKRNSIPAHVTQGTQRDAILKSCGANGKHGLPRCNADKRRAVTRVLSDPEWSKWSDREIARQCAVSNRYVANLRPFVTVNVHSEERTFTTKHGTVSTMKVAQIGKADPTPADPVQEGQALHAAGFDDSTSPDEPVQRKTSDGHWITEDGLILRYIPGSDRGWCPRCADWSNFMLMGQDTWACKKCDWRVQDDAIRIWEPEPPDPTPTRPAATPTIIPDNMLTDLQEAQRLLRKWWERLPSSSITRNYVDIALVQVGKAIVSAGKAPASPAFGKPAERIHQ